MISTLRVFLANNGLVDVSATELGIHRHTLRYRLRRITELLDCSLDDPTARAELWLALRMRELS
ncbi:helix-turn-helix domain-containing protein [Saccharopolyspora hattusasensis]|uniref:helix-turn-helix domain-containing protein n=1 Tax=Saccharopolyspora hattusasensis TaxID=1128679 RepID=UPI003D98E0B9